MTFSPIDAADDFSGTGEGQDRWTLVGHPHDFDGFGAHVPIPCYAASGSTFASVCTVGTTTPQFQECLSAAAAEQTGPQGQTGTASLMKVGCYAVGNSVMVPLAQGTFGTMIRNDLNGLGYSEWHPSIIKGWKIKERLAAQFRAEIYNVVNSTEFAAPNGTDHARSS